MNSVEKLPDGDYLTSGRRTYTLYKISHKDSSILWRLNGDLSDFEMKGGLSFSGQHDARCLSQNSTHMIVSVMDNAKGPGTPPPTSKNSRGLIMSLNTETMVATELMVYQHPLGPGHYAPGRGNFQTLENGNAFISWMMNAIQSEHTPDGKVAMYAKMPSGLKTYRGYKFPWVGRPKSPPDVHSELVVLDDTPFTAVHVSWNGDTEVAKWRLYESNYDGDDKELIAEKERTGFETALMYNGYATYVVVEGIGRDGNPLAQSEVARTLGRRGRVGAASAHGRTWQDDVMSVFGLPLVAFVGGVLFCVAAALSAWGVWVARRKGAFSWRRKKQQVYADLSDVNGDIEGEKLLDKNNQAAGGGGRSDDD